MVVQKFHDGAGEMYGRYGLDYYQMTSSAMGWRG